MNNVEREKLNESTELEINNFLETLESKLEEKNLSVPQFAKLLGVSKMIVYNWLNKKSMMSLDKYFKALQILEIK